MSDDNDYYDWELFPLHLAWAEGRILVDDEDEDIIDAGLEEIPPQLPSSNSPATGEADKG